MRESWFNPLGLVTKPNEMGIYPAGAMLSASNLVARAPGELEARPTESLPTSSFATAGYRWLKLIWTGNQFLTLGQNDTSTSSNSIGWYNPNTTTWSSGVLPGTNDPTIIIGSVSGWADMAIFRDRIIMCTELGDVFIGDYLNPSSTAQRTFRRAGLPQPKVLIANETLTNAQGVDDKTMVGYTAIVRRTYADGYEVVSPPAPILKVTSQHGPGTVVDYTVRVYLNTSSAGDGLPRFVAGDVVELYRTQAVSNPTYSDTMEPGASAYLVASTTLTTTALSVDIKDSAKAALVGQSFGGLGKALYTNPGQSGLEGANTPPPAAKRIAIYKGRAFYANYQTPGEVIVSMRGGFPELLNPAPIVSGVGLRQIASGTIASGVATMSGLSAAELSGLVPGQRISGFGVSLSFISSINVGAGTLLMVHPASASGTAAYAVYDQVEMTLGPQNPAIYNVDYTWPLAPMLYLVSSRSLSYDGEAFDQSYYLSTLYFPLSSIRLRATNGQNFDPALPLITQINSSGVVSAGGTAAQYAPSQYPNGVRWSKDQQPEAVPPTNEIFVGQGEIYGMYSTRDALWIFASDGLWRLSGSMARAGQVVDVRVDPVDSTLILSGPQAGCVLRDSVYAYTNRGLVRVDDNGVFEISERVVGDLLPGRPWNPGPYTALAADESNDDIYITLWSTSGTGSVDNTDLTYVYSTIYNVFTSVNRGQSAAFTRPTAYAYNKDTQSLWTQVSTVSGGSAGGQLYNVTTAGRGWMASSLEFQPVYGEDPLLQKQWIDATFVLNLEASLSPDFIPVWSGTSYTTASSTNIPRSYGANSTARINFGAPRAVAVGPSITIGLSCPDTSSSSAPITLKGVSLRFEYLTDQQVTR